ncbi:hypothetical protein BYT27DRAFT_6747376 [Phlegmacium glaucopus]|nr:hypothetical protein BYT27DRAFT_6747376 [Phlegmacium glaucopus]
MCHYRQVCNIYLRCGHRIQQPDEHSTLQVQSKSFATLHTPGVYPDLCSVSNTPLTSTGCALIVNVPNWVEIYTFTNTRTFSFPNPTSMLMLRYRTMYDF